MQPVFFAILAFISTFLGGLFSLHHHKRLHYIMSFTAGVLIAVAFFDIIPELFALVEEHHLDITPSLIALVSGFFVIHILEKYAVLHHGHESEYASHRHPHVGMVSTLGLIFHSVLDGVGIGLGFHVSPQVGLLVAIAVIAHDFSDGLNTVSLMLVNKNTRKKAFTFLVLDALAPVLGAISTFFITIPESILVLYLGFFAGFLLYIGASDLLPEAHSKHSSWKMIALTIAGAVFIFIVTRFT
ncbi:ZIP family metal transporter [Candidatus Microgenomates bacterium]|nr:ZIP family metal transporter [Candidatus Microgenomates bacterium]